MAWSGERQLIMVEQPGCVYCARWNAEIGGIYAKTDEGKLLPLRRVDLRGSELKEMPLKGRVLYTPTFLLTEGGAEIARIEGYSGDELFWWMLSSLISQHVAKEE
ncbi:MAG: hypothetical protein ACPGNV_10650 [Mangrovicoccus sp.]